MVRTVDGGIVASVLDEDCFGVHHEVMLSRKLGIHELSLALLALDRVAGILVATEVILGRSTRWRQRSEFCEDSGGLFKGRVTMREEEVERK